MFCRNCGNEINDNQAICLNCGVKVGEGNKFCSNCGKEVAENAEVCLNCGVTMKKNSNNGSYDIQGKDKTLMILICLFLGGIGIHNFMLGETKKGVAKIVLSLCCGIGGILALIDLIKICMGRYVIDPDALI